MTRQQSPLQGGKQNHLLRRWIFFFGDHPPPHIHAVYGEYVGLFNIETLEMIEGDLPKRAKK